MLKIPIPFHKQILPNRSLIEKETYIGTILQNAANPTFRFDPRKGKSPSAFFAEVDPTPSAPGINELVKPPTFPNVSPVAPDV